MSTTVRVDAPRKATTQVLRDKKVILLEFNELSPKLIEGFMAQGELPNFRRLRDESRVFISDAEEAAPNLEPWIQWVTVHSGLSYDQHGIFHLGDGHKLENKCLWDILSDAGLTVWVCGSMNQRVDLPINGAVLPDPWAAEARPYPESLQPFYRFVRQNVQEYTNDRVPLSMGDYVSFVKFMVTHGLRLRTAIAIAKQLLLERVNKQAKWRRATILDKLQWDVFRSYYRELKPQFSTFFINSTAHFQHAHWRDMDPEPFKVKPTEDHRKEFGGAVLFGYQEMDRIVGEAIDMAGTDTTLILSSALGQQPCLIYEDIGGKTFYRARVFDRVMEWLGAPGKYQVAPVMSEEFHVHFDTEANAIEGARLLRSLQVNGKPAMNVMHESGPSVYTGCRIWEQLPPDAVLEHTALGKQIPFFRLFYQVESLKSGMHHPDGILWVREPGVKPQATPQRVPLLSVAPTVLRMFGVQPPPEMTGRPL